MIPDYILLYSQISVYPDIIKNVSYSSGWEQKQSQTVRHYVESKLDVSIKFLHSELR